MTHGTGDRLPDRGLLRDRGVAVGTPVPCPRRTVAEFPNGLSPGHSVMAREAVAELDRRSISFGTTIAGVFKAPPTRQRSATITGLGPNAAAAIVAAIGDGREVRTRRHRAGWLGRVPG